MESRTTFYGPVLAIIALTSLQLYGIPLPTEPQEDEDVSPRSGWPTQVRDRVAALVLTR